MPFAVNSGSLRCIHLSHTMRYQHESSFPFRKLLGDLRALVVLSRNLESAATTTAATAEATVSISTDTTECFVVLFGFHGVNAVAVRL